MKTISSVKYYTGLGLCLAISELQKQSRELEKVLTKLFHGSERLSEDLMDLSYAGTNKDGFDMMLKDLDIIVFDEPVKDVTKNEDTIPNST